MSNVDISGLDKAAVLMALYDDAQTQGMGKLHYTPDPLSNAEAQKLLDDLGERKYFDYLRGRVMKVELSGDSFDPGLYDRDNGNGAAEAALRKLRPERPGWMGTK